MANNQIQVPPPVGSSGQHLDAIVISSSELRQVIVVGDPTSTGNLMTISSTGGIFVAGGGGSTAVNITGSSGAIGPVTSSGGQLVSVSNPSTVFSLSSNPTVNVSSGVFTLSSNPTVVSASSGLVQLSSAPLVVVATSGGTIPVSLSTVFSLSSNPTVISASSGVVQVLTTGTLIIVSASSGLVQTLTSGPTTISGTVTILSASSGLVQTLTTGATVISSASGTQVMTLTGTSSGPSVVTSSGGLSVHITDVTGPVTSSWGVVIQESTGAGGGVVSTYFVVTTVQAIKTIAGRLMGYSAFSSTLGPAGLVIRFYNFTTANVSVGTSMAAVFPVQGLLSTAATAVAEQPISPTWFGPNGLNFGTAISVDSGITSTGVVFAGNVYLTAFYV